MLTNGGKHFMAMRLNYNAKTSNQNEIPGMTDFSGFQYNRSYSSSWRIEALMKVQCSAITYGASTMSGFGFGTGNTAPTAEDSTLSGNFIPPANYACSASVKTLQNTHECLEVEAVYTITNTSAEAITIGEVFLADWMGGKVNSNGSQRYCPVMLDRARLESPVTIEPGDVGIVTYTVRMNYSTT